MIRPAYAMPSTDRILEINVRRYDDGLYGY